jgi:hypothetical protein
MLNNSILRTILALHIMCHCSGTLSSGNAQLLPKPPWWSLFKQMTNASHNTPSPEMQPSPITPPTAQCLGL